MFRGIRDGRRSPVYCVFGRYRAVPGLVRVGFAGSVSRIVGARWAIPRPKALGGYRGIAGGIRITLLARVKVFKTPPGL
jgi:hypothetical protein